MRRRPVRVPASRSGFASFRFPPEVIMVAVLWYLRYGLSYRDVEELLAERGHHRRSRHCVSLGAAIHSAADRCGLALPAMPR